MNRINNSTSLMKNLFCLLDKKLAALTTIGLSRYAPIMGRAYDLVARAQRARQKDYMDANLHSLLQSLDCTKKVNFLDVGAGESGDPVVSKYPDHFQTILVEPRKDEAERLRQKGEALIIDKALGSSEGIEVLHHTSAAELSSILEPDSRFARIYGSDGMEIRGLSQIETTSIEAAMSELDIASLDYLKVDTQGTELAVLAGLGEYRPLIVAAEVFFIPAYKKSCLIWDIGQYLSKHGYLLFDLVYRNLTLSKTKKMMRQPVGRLQVSGRAWFMPDWQSDLGLQMIFDRDIQYAKLMAMFGMQNFLIDVLSSINTPNKHQILEVLNLEATN